MRFRKLIQQEIEKKDISYRELSRLMDGIPVPCLHDYATRGTEPRLAQLEKMSRYFGESISQLLSEDDDLTSELITVIRSLPDADKHRLLKQIKNK